MRAHLWQSLEKPGSENSNHLIMLSPTCQGTDLEQLLYCETDSYREFFALSKNHSQCFRRDANIVSSMEMLLDNYIVKWISQSKKQKLQTATVVGTPFLSKTFLPTSCIRSLITLGLLPLWFPTPTSTLRPRTNSLRCWNCAGLKEDKSRAFLSCVYSAQITSSGFAGTLLICQSK